jgi:hypothetical protein
MPRPSRGPTHRVYLTLTEMQHRLLTEFASAGGRAPATFASEVLTSILDSALTEDGDIDQRQVEATINALRGDPTFPANIPRWRRPLDAILLDTAWWSAWYPELCSLLGRDKNRLGYSRDRVANREGYFDLLEFLFPALEGPRGRLTWRSTDYPIAAEAQRRGEGGAPLRPIWERVIRHVVLAMTGLEEAKNPSLAMAVEDQIRHGWLSTLLSLVGEASPGKDALPHTPTERLI